MVVTWGSRRRGSRKLSGLAVAVAVALGASMVLAAAPHTASAQQAAERQEYDIAAQPLGNALNQLAIQSGEEIMVPPDFVRGIRSRPLKGRYTFEQAIGGLLEGSGLSWQRNARGLVTVGKAAEAKPVPARASRPATTSEDSAPVTDMPELLVRGSRSLNADIRRTINDPQPYVIFERQDIERSGAINLNDFLLMRVSANASSTAPDMTTSTVGDISDINLRGLGNGQTLILIDGRRTAPVYFGGSPRQSNLNGIPLASVERIEILPTTASAIYGGSATGGVINVVLRRDYRGGEIAISHDNSFDTDSSINRIDFSYGSNIGEKTTVLINGSHAESNLLLRRDRDFRERAFERFYGTDPSYLARTLFYNSATPNISSQSGGNLTLRDGTPLDSPITHAPTGYLGPDSDGGAALLANAGRLNNEFDGNANYVNGGGAFGKAPRSSSVSVSFRHGFADWMDGFLDVSASENRSGQPAGALARFSLPAGHAYNPFQEAIFVIVPTDEFNHGSNQRNELERASAGLIARLGAEWAGSFDFTWSKSTNAYARWVGQVDTAAALVDGFNPLVDHYNVAGRSLQPYLTLGDERISGPSSAYSYNPTLRFSGPLWQLPAGPVSVSLLLEQQRIELEGRTAHYYPDSPSESFQFYPARSQDMQSAYAEIAVPLFGEAGSRVGLHALDLQFALRHDNYKTETGDNVQWSAGQTRPESVMTTNEVSETTGLLGVKYAPLAGLTFRASHGTGFVIPDVSQLIASTGLDSFIDPGLFDPRRGNTINPTPYVLVEGGNPDLHPERSETTSFGVIVEPEKLPGFRASLDYTNLKKTGNIAILSRALMLENEDRFPDRIQRGPNLPDDPAGWAGPIVYFDRSYINAASARYEALDAQLKYGFDLKNGLYVEFWGNGTWTLKAEQQTVEGGPSNNLRGISASSGAVTPLNFRAFYGVNVEGGDWSAGWTIRHYSSYLVADPELESSAPVIAAQGNGGHVPRQMLHDFSGSWRPAKPGGDRDGFGALLSGLEISGGIRNVFNTKPEVDLSNDYLFYSYLVDPRLRTYYVQLKYAF